MDIVLYLKNLQGRGVQKVYLNLAKGFLDRGHDVHFIIRENSIAFDISFLPHLHVYDKDTTAQIDTLLMHLNNPVLISNDVHFTQNLTQIVPERIYYTVHMLWGKRVFRQLRFWKLYELKNLYRNKQVIAVSEAVKEDLLKRVGIKPKFIKVIHDGFDIAQIQEKSNAYIPAHKNFIVSVGALSSEKNHALLLHAYQKADISEALVIIGEGKLRSKLEDLANRLKIAHKVHFMGFLKNPYPYIKDAQLMVMTSRDEALPGAAIESLILYTPVVSMNSEGIHSVLTGRLATFIAKNREDLVHKIKIALNAYPQITLRDFQKFDYRYIADEYLSMMHKDESQ